MRKLLQKNKKLLKQFEQWKAARLAFNEAIRRLDEEAVRLGWQRDYMLGLDSDKVPLRGTPDQTFFEEIQARQMMAKPCMKLPWNV